MSQKPLLKSRLFKLPQHRRFNFPARYYDEEKERLENRIKELKSGFLPIQHKKAFNKNHQYKKAEQKLEYNQIINHFWIIGF